MTEIFFSRFNAGKENHLSEDISRTANAKFRCFSSTSTRESKAKQVPLTPAVVFVVWIIKEADPSDSLTLTLFFT